MKKKFSKDGGKKNPQPHCAFLFYEHPGLQPSAQGQHWWLKKNLINDCLKNKNKKDTETNQTNLITGTDPVGAAPLPLLLAPNKLSDCFFFFPNNCFFFLGSNLSHLAAQGAGRVNPLAGSPRFSIISKGEAVGQETGGRGEPGTDVSAPFPAQLGEGAGHPPPQQGSQVPLLERAWQPTPCPGYSLAHSSGPFWKCPQIQHDTPLNQCACQRKGKPNTRKPRVLHTGCKEG